MTRTDLAAGRPPEESRRQAHGGPREPSHEHAHEESPATLLESLLPASVVVREIRGLPSQVLDLYPEELAVVAAAVDKRRREFAAVRRCARRALAVLGHPPVPLLPGERGAPVWPAGIVGSMTHCAGFAAAALARATDLASLGIDAEPDEILPDGVLEAIALPRELALVGRLGRERPEVRWDRLLFCAKEAVYKTWFPLTGKWLGFEEALIELRLAGAGAPEPLPAEAESAGAPVSLSASGTFTARLLVPGPVVGGDRIGEFAGHWGMAGGVLAAAIALPRPAAQTPSVPRTQEISARAPSR